MEIRTAGPGPDQIATEGVTVNRPRNGHVADRSTRIARIGAEVRSGTYEPPLENVVESLVAALLPHFGFRR